MVNLELLLKVKAMRAAQVHYDKFPNNITAFARLKKELEMDKIIFDEVESHTKEIFNDDTMGSYERFQKWEEKNK